MSLYWTNGIVALHQGDSRHLPLEDGSVSCIVTSPPYWGLRRYAGDQELVWDAPAEGCEHVWGDSSWKSPNSSGGLQGGFPTGLEGGVPRWKVADYHSRSIPSNTCARCNAWRGAFGLEPTPHLYIAHLMVFMAELWRVLRADGCVFLNLGDSMAGSGGEHKHDGGQSGLTNNRARVGYFPKPRYDIRSKSLCLIPERFALACQEAGWIVRSRIAWVKANPMPESVRDRPTDAWEHIFMLVKQERYWWDQEAVREPLPESSIRRYEHAVNHNEQFNPMKHKSVPGGQSPMEILTRAAANVLASGGRNLRNVWNINTEPYPLAHFAVFPTEIPRRCILAACPPAICKACGVPRERIMEHTNMEWTKSAKRLGDSQHGRTRMGGTQEIPATNRSVGWTDCGCGAGWTPGLVLDPFVGSGTTCAVAQELGRRAVGVDLSAEYLALSQKRIEAIPLPMDLPL